MIAVLNQYTPGRPDKMIVESVGEVRASVMK